MNTLPAINQRAVQLCPSPVAIWQMLLTRLLEQHYGLTLNDTPFGDEASFRNISMPVSHLLMPLIFWWKSTSWFVSTAGI
jgi:hypothetical protein